MFETSLVVIVDGQKHYFDDDFILEKESWSPLGVELSIANCETQEDLLAVGESADILVYLGLHMPFTARVIHLLPRCRLIARYGVGMDSVDISAATDQGIVVANAAEYCLAEVADHTAALILGLARRIVFLDRFVRNGNWNNVSEFPRLVPRLSRQTLGLIGFGCIARCVASKMASFVGNTIAYDPYVSKQVADAYGVQLVALEDLLEHADFVSVHTPLLSETRGLISRAELDLMKPTAYLINTSRGPVVDETALSEVLKENRIAGAALDVFEIEPLSDESPLCTFENVILTPHFAAYSIQAIEDLRASVIQTVADVVQGYWPPYVMNPTVQPRYPLRRRSIDKCQLKQQPELR